MVRRPRCADCPAKPGKTHVTGRTQQPFYSPNSSSQKGPAMSTLYIHLVEFVPPPVNGVRPYSRALDRPEVVAALNRYFDTIVADRDRPAAITGLQIGFTNT